MHPPRAVVAQADERGRVCFLSSSLFVLGTGIPLRDLTVYVRVVVSVCVWWGGRRGGYIHVLLKGMLRA